jgi:hypothetical protein
MPARAGSDGVINDEWAQTHYSLLITHQRKNYDQELFQNRFKKFIKEQDLFFHQRGGAKHWSRLRHADHFICER